MRSATWGDLFLFGAFAAMTVQWPLAFGPLSFDLAEPLVILFLIGYLLTTRDPHVALTPGRRAVWVGVLALVAWALAVWLAAPNWRERRADLLGWIAPLAVLGVLLRERPEKWGRVARIFALAVQPTQAAVFIERALNVGGPFYHPVDTKTLFGWGGARTYPVAGLFGHSNMLAGYLLDLRSRACGGARDPAAGWTARLPAPRCSSAFRARRSSRCSSRAGDLALVTIAPAAVRGAGARRAASRCSSYFSSIAWASITA
jgi:hypothetical protein